MHKRRVKSIRQVFFKTQTIIAALIIKHSYRSSQGLSTTLFNKVANLQLWLKCSSFQKIMISQTNINPMNNNRELLKIVEDN